MIEQKARKTKYQRENDVILRRKRGGAWVARFHDKHPQPLDTFYQFFSALFLHEGTGTVHTFKV